MTLTGPARIDKWLDIEPTNEKGVLTIRKFTIPDLIDLLGNIANNPQLARWNHLYIYADSITINSDSHRNIVMDRSKQFVTIIARELKILNSQLVFVTEEPSNLLNIDLYLQEFSGSEPSCVIMPSAYSQQSTSFLLKKNSTEPNRFAYNKTIKFNRKGDDAEFIVRFV
ncbi:MAG: hypothetical protein GDA48_19920 [Hormoscilla sp. GM102CHS1]|nr:hypothetical protein [Hormoscilla sp. GM102CHS1]